MDKLPVLAILLISIPEEIMISALGLFLFGIRPKGRFLILIGILQSLISYLVRQLPLFFGLHVIIQALLFALVITLIIQLPYRVSLTAMTVSITIYAVMEAIFVPLLVAITDVPLAVILASTKLRILYFLPQGIMMLIIVFLVHHYDFKLFSHYYSETEGRGKWWRS